MYLKKFLIVTVLIISFSSVLAQTYYGQVNFVPAGTPVSVTISQALSSEFTRVGETFTASLSSPIYAGSSLLAPAGSQVQGQVVNVESAGRTGRPGSMDLRLTNIITPDGHRIPLSASIDQTTFKLEADSGRVSHFAKAGVVGAGAGALSGLVGAAISGGKKGKATAIGTGIGAGTGLLVGAVQKGAEFVIQSGTMLPFKLDQAIQSAAQSAPVQEFNPGYSNPGSGFQDPNTYQPQNTQQFVNPYL